MNQVKVNQTKLQELVGQMLQDLGAAVNSPLVLIGDKLGLYKASLVTVKSAQPN